MVKLQTTTSYYETFLINHKKYEKSWLFVMQISPDESWIKKKKKSLLKTECRLTSTQKTMLLSQLFLKNFCLLQPICLERNKLIVTSCKPHNLLKTMGGHHSNVFIFKKNLRKLSVGECILFSLYLPKLHSITDVFLKKLLGRDISQDTSGMLFLKLSKGIAEGFCLQALPTALQKKYFQEQLQRYLIHYISSNKKAPPG